MLLIDYARDVLGIPCRASQGGRHFGWTTDAEKAELMRLAGASVTSVPSLDQRPEARKFDGFEISFYHGAEKAEAVAA